MQQKTDILLPLWPTHESDKQLALKKCARKIQKHTCIAQINKSVTSYPAFQLGDKVWVQNVLSKRWEQQATILAVMESDEFYSI